VSVSDQMARHGSLRPGPPEAAGPGALSPGFRRLAVATTVASLILVALGGTVRATDNGLACPDWPRCHGEWVPPLQAGLWIEHTHRLVAGVVGLMTLALAVWAVARYRHRRDILWPSVTALLAVVGQAALGALVVLHLLRAELVTGHLAMAMLVVACLLCLAVRADEPARTGAAARRRDPRLARVSAAVAALAFAQILVGGHVTGIGAGLAYTDFPLMDGRVVPAVTNAQELYHAAHRGLALLLVVAVLWLCGVAVRQGRRRVARGDWLPRDRWLVRLPVVAAALVALQVLLGVANLRNGLSWVSVVPHLAVASWLWAALVLTTLLAHRRGPAQSPAHAPGPAQSHAPGP
jgi:heme a synthase